MLKAQQDKSAMSKGGVFGTIAVRFSGKDDIEKGAMPGPGNYEAKAEPSPPRHRGDQSTFASKTARFRATTAPATVPEMHKNGASSKGEARGDPRQLGPGSYAAPDPWAKQPRHPGFKKSAFGSDSSRQPAVGNSNETPGPGRYKQGIDVNQVYKPLHMAGKDTAFGGMQRFKANPNSTPGPGKYVGQVRRVTCVLCDLIPALHQR